MPNTHAPPEGLPTAIERGFGRAAYSEHVQRLPLLAVDEMIEDDAMQGGRGYFHIVLLHI